MDRKKITPILNKLIVEVGKEIDVDQIYLFGSYAKGEAIQNSDIDVLVVGKFQQKDGFERFSHLYDIQKRVQSQEEIHIFGASSEDFLNAKRYSRLGAIKEEGILLFSK